MGTEYQLHPSVELRQLFAKMRVPHQGQDPPKATALFVGLDANYSAQPCPEVRGPRIPWFIPLNGLATPRGCLDRTCAEVGPKSAEYCPNAANQGYGAH